MHEIAECETRLQKEEGPVAGSTRQAFNENELLPCHYFDYMYGTSTGGLISVMLARLRMTVPQCLEIYRRVGHELFGHRRNVLPLATKYHHKPLEKAVQEIVSQYCKHHEDCDGNDWHPWDTEVEEDVQASTIKTPNGSVGDSSTWSSAAGKSSTVKPTERICQSICLTATHSGQIGEAYLLRSYNHQYNEKTFPPWAITYNEGADKLKIWQVTRATSAAPFYFDMLVADVRNERMGFKDGGIRENNPSFAAYSEHSSMHGDEREPGLLLSIGTGRPNTENDGFAAVWPGPLGKFKLLQKWSEKFAVFKNVLIKYTEGEKQHTNMRVIAKGEHRWYKRLNVDKGLHDLKLDNWEKGSWTNPQTGKTEVVNGGKTLSRMELATKEYLSRDNLESPGGFKEYQPPKVVLQQIAERLVRHRRLREATKHEDLRRWQTHMGQWLTGELRPEDAMVVDPEPPRKGSEANSSRLRSRPAPTKP
ncbi:FabD/lysophospholipase-like protein [Ophiobolus disseminans]|uniref:FabD/lysophospholipase-like protein n=1 Tax=Ophiobolus disseminans TaxID=1469910 RepID=A0A6A6ZMQ2_9PLEO|nr:FabD/lysophospholipase-like protein [Ophiobolus disseminans]